MQGIKPCPFCSRIPLVRNRLAEKNEASATGLVWSITCFGGGTNAHAWFYADSQSKVLKMWNQREGSQ